jgi:hypothetical protein
MGFSQYGPWLCYPGPIFGGVLTRHGWEKSGNDSEETFQLQKFSLYTK